MKEQRKVLKIGLAIIGGLALICFIIGSFLDQQITKALGNYESWLGILFTLLTPVFSLAIGEMAGALLIFMPKKENKTWDIIIRVLGAVIFLGFSAFSVKEGIEYVEFPVMAEHESTYKVLAIVLVVLIDLAIIFFAKIASKRKTVDEQRLIPTVIVILVIIAAWLFVSEVIKHLACRPRPRNIYLHEKIEAVVEFRNWYQWQPFFCFKEGMKDCKSFVSGHTFIAACTIGSVPLIHSLSKERAGIKLTIAGLCAGGVFTFVVAFSRIVAYAHFMTDVMGAVIFSCGAQAIILNVAPILYNKLKSRKKRHN